ncbi:hypothetical protein V9K67_11115 [Paraflavisolibacter sp. H34]|uniref:hypothetical protein n=1 Tax=Huijunlia imazamoxiresistens TaxID=3127457 RepID=UPI00301698FD
MALSASTLQPVAPAPASQPAASGGNGLAASILGLLMLSMMAGTASRRQLRQLQRKMTWMLVKEKVRSAFSGAARASERKVLIYILLGIALLILVIYYPIAALILAIVALVLLLTGNL